MRAILLSTLLCPILLLAQPVAALTGDELTDHLKQTLGEALPMTLIGPLTYDGLEVTEADGAFAVTITGARYGKEASEDAAELGDIEISLEDLGDGKVETTVSLPVSIDQGDRTYRFDSHALNGVWDLERRVYDDFSYSFDGLKVASDSGKQGSLAGFSADLSPYENGSQSFEITYDEVRLEDPADKQLFVAEPSSLTLSVDTPTDAEPFRRLRDFVVGLAEFDKNDLEDDPAKTFQLFRGLMVPVSDASIEGTLGTITYENGLEDLTVSLDGGSINGSYENYLSEDAGRSSGVATLNGIQFRSPEAAGVISELSVDGEVSGVNGKFAYAFSDELYAKVLEEGAKINLGDLFNLYFNFDDVELVYSLKGLSLELPEQGNIDLESAAFTVGVNDARSDSAALTIGIDQSKFEAARFSDPLTSSLMPQLIDLTIRAKKLPLASLREALAEESIDASMAVGNEEELASMFQQIGFKLLGIMMLNAPQLTIESSMIDSKTLELDLDGAFDVDPASPRFVSGGVQIVAHGVEALQAAIQEAMASDDPTAKQFAVPALTGLGVAQGFGKKQDDGSLLFDIQVTSEGAVTINGAPLPLP